MHWKIRALAQSGRKIILHYFNYREERGAGDLAPFCMAVHKYSRKNLAHSLPLNLPYTVASRINKELVKRLNEDDHPVLLEGLHTAGILPFLDPLRKKLLRMHNVESTYYRKLSLAERNPWRRAYYQLESSRLHRFQQTLDPSLPIACISLDDREELSARYALKNQYFIPAFLPWQEVKGMEGHGDYCLYHGNMTVTENEAAASWLITEVFSRLSIPLVIAGRGISKRLMLQAKAHSQVSVVSDPAESELNDLISRAHVHVLPSLNRTGVKLKLLHALFEGRFCITNSNGVSGSGIGEMAIIAQTAGEFADRISTLMDSSFTGADKTNRRQLLTVYDNRANAQKINELL